MLVPLLATLLAGPIPQQPEEPRVYAAVLDTLAHAESSILLVDSAYPSTSRPGGVASMPATLPTRRTIRWVSRAEVTDSLGFHPNPTQYWTRFRQRFPDAKCWYALGPIYLRSSDTEAVVTYEQHCGPDSGQGGWMVLQLVKDRWTVVERRIIWIS
jgi:hypothetical protein